MDFLITGSQRAFLLRHALELIRDRYDFIIIDTPPNLGTITINALTASTGVIIPAFAEIFSVQGIVNLCDTVKEIQSSVNAELINRRVLITRHKAYVRVQSETASAIREIAGQRGVKVFNTPIRDSVVITEAASLKCDIFAHKPNSGAALDYSAFIDELLNDLYLS